MTVGGGLGRGSQSIGGPGFSNAYHSSGMSGTGNYGKGLNLREYAKQQEAKKEADRENAISREATDVRVESALAFMREKSDEKKHPGLLHGFKRRASNLFHGKPKILNRQQALAKATAKVDKEIAAAKAKESEAIAKDFRQHGIGGRKTKKHRNKKNNTKRRR